MKKHIGLIGLLLCSFIMVLSFMQWIYGYDTNISDNAFIGLLIIGIGYLFGGLLNRAYKKDE